MQWQRLRAEREADQLRDCTFSPELVAAPRPALRSQPPLHRRLAELQRRRRHALCAAAQLFRTRQGLWHAWKYYLSKLLIARQCSGL